MCTNIKTAKNVGKRYGNVCIYLINSEQMYKDEYSFYLSVNGVWLVKKVPVKYLKKYEEEN